jgi:hypothetical protein
VLVEFLIQQFFELFDLRLQLRIKTDRYRLGGWDNRCQYTTVIDFVTRMFEERIDKMVDKMGTKTVAEHLILIFTNPFVIDFFQDDLNQFRRFKRLKRNQSRCDTVIDVVADIGDLICSIDDHRFDARMGIKGKRLSYFIGQKRFVIGV